MKTIKSALFTFIASAVVATGSAFAWNGGSAAWADGPWVNAETDEAVTYEDGVSILPTTTEHCA